MKTYVVYEHISPSGKVYVGQSCEFKVRWEGKGNRYLNKNKEGKYVQPYFANALLKYGWDNFEHKIILEGISKSEANYAEKYLIKWYKLHNMSYNCTDGGDGGLGIKKRLTEAQKKRMSEYMLKHSHFKGKHQSEEQRRKISEANKGRKVDANGRRNMSKAHIGSKSPWKWVKVYAFDKNTKELTYEYPSISEASNITGISIAGIVQSASGRCQTAGNFIWSYSSTLNLDDPRFSRIDGQKVYCYDKFGNLVGEYNNTTEAAKAVNGNMRSLCNCCCGNTPSYKGYIWTKIKR